MSEPIDRLRRADPAAGLPGRPDERAEDDLQVLLSTPRSAPASLRGHAGERRRVAPLLVTAAVALVIVVITAAALGMVRPRVDDAAAPTPTATATATATVEPPYLLEDCTPAAVVPFECGTYTSVYGATSVTGDTGGPKKDPLSISFTRAHGVLFLSARSASCFAAVVPVRYDGKRLIRIGRLLLGQAEGCTGVGTNDAQHWADPFLNGPLAVDASGGGLAFDTASAMVTFEFQGRADIGEQQQPRNDTTCVAAHVEPFSCATYRSTAGTGTLAFLGSRPFTLRFRHTNGELTADLYGRCNSLGVILEPDAHALVVAIPGFTSMAACAGDRGTDDTAVRAFFRGELEASVDGDTITVTKGGSSATFRR